MKAAFLLEPYTVDTSILVLRGDDAAYLTSTTMAWARCVLDSQLGEPRRIRRAGLGHTSWPRLFRGERESDKTHHRQWKFYGTPAYSSSCHPSVAPRAEIPNRMLGLHRLRTGSRKNVSRYGWELLPGKRPPLRHLASLLGSRRVILEVASQIDRGASTPVVTGSGIGH